MTRLLFKSLVWYWGPAVLMLLCIGFESTDMLSAGHTGRFILPILRSLFPHAGLDDLQTVHAMLRKAGHVIGYAILSWSLFRAWWGTAGMQSPVADFPWEWRFAIFAVLGTAAVAVFDELHQMSIPSRGGSVHDIVLDTSAAIAAQLLIAYLLHWRNRRNARPLTAE